MDKSEREAIRARCEAATPGPWKCERAIGASFIYGENGIVIDFDGNKDPDTIFIIHARQDIPALLDALDEAEADIKNRDEIIYEALKRAMERALERALRYSAIDLCCTCLYEKTCDQKQRKECGKAGLWEFDVVRFAREADNA